jgi:hypothetical protein
MRRHEPGAITNAKAIHLNDWRMKALRGSSGMHVPYALYSLHNLPPRISADNRRKCRHGLNPLKSSADRRIRGRGRPAYRAAADRPLNRACGLRQKRRKRLVPYSPARYGRVLRPRWDLSGGSSHPHPPFEPNGTRTGTTPMAPRAASRRPPIYDVGKLRCTRRRKVTADFKRLNRLPDGYGNLTQQFLARPAAACTDAAS